MLRRDVITIRKIVSEMQIGIDMLGDTKLEDFMQNEMMQRALCMTCINIGELVKVVTDETRSMYREIPWKAIAGMRDITAHRYQTLRMDDVYNTIHDDYPDLMQKLSNILA